jgi:hypothetical protein
MSKIGKILKENNLHARIVNYNHQLKSRKDTKKDVWKRTIVIIIILSVHRNDVKKLEKIWQTIAIVAIITTKNWEKYGKECISNKS